MPIGELCNREVVVVRPQESALEAARLMRSFHVGDVVVVEEREGSRVPVGIVTDRDLVVELLAQEVTPQSVAVKDIMSTAIWVAKEQDELLPTIQQMRQKGVRRVPVVDGEDHLIGILTVDDVIELVAEQLTDLVRLVSMERLHEQKYRP